MGQLNIYLIGYMGSGKTYQGRRLASLLKRRFVDLDQSITERTGYPIPELIAERGLEVFRRIEKESLHATAGLSAAVIACGGGTPCYFDNMQWINRHGVSVYLDTPVSLLVKRLAPERAGRPLLAGLSEKEVPGFIEAHLAERSAFYNQAHIRYKQAAQISAAEELAAYLERIIGH